MEGVFGVVESIDDPIGAQRVQVRIYGYYDDIPASDLPWCQVGRSPTDALTFNMGPSSHNLVPGSQVYCVWLDRNYQQPLVICQVPRIDDCFDNPDMSKQIINTQQGHKIVITSEEVSITDNRDNIIKLSPEGIIIKSPNDMSKINLGDVNVDAGGQKSLKVGSDYNEDVTLNKTIKIGKDLSIEAINCNIKCSGETKIDASKVSIKNIVGPNQFCKIPACLFTGAPHISPSTDE